ncbi:putative siderophore-dependent iron transporter [Elsinoe ampelina]|uniref:Putative siderophore-dependent iron transporter n=1 Tax=Elsinoe ampelina TaxID=302913 RepID=A0A6A6GNI2_9PEZI|nr:putative siderophore-dependent iron transporter [Elsinoe ampelina]
MFSRQHATDPNVISEASPLIPRDDERDYPFPRRRLSDHGERRVETFSERGSDYGSEPGSSSKSVSSPASKRAINIVYFGVLLIGSIKSLEEQTTFNFLPVATSSFKAHSLLATVAVVQSVTLAVIKPPISKVADVFGRLEAFALSMLFYIIGYVMQASADDAAAFIVATAFYATGQTGVQILSQIVIADISDLLDRTILSSFLDVPFMLSVWIGPVIAQLILKNLTWRWGYGIWAIIVPISFIPLAISLFSHRRDVKQRAQSPKPPALSSLSHQLDLVGLILLGGAITFILIPLTLHAHAFEERSKTMTGAFLALGLASLLGLIVYECSSKVGPNPIIPAHLFKSRTVVAGVALAFFYFMAFYLSVLPYFYSYLLVVHDQSVSAAGHITQMFTFSCTIAAVAVSFWIKRSRRYRFILICGCIFYSAGLIWMCFLKEGTSVMMLVGSQLTLGVGGGLIHGPAQLGVQAAVRHQDVATATALFLTFLEVGGAGGSAISGSIWSGTLLSKLEEYLPEETAEHAAAIFGDVNLAATKWPMGDPTRDAINRAYQETIRKILYVAVIVSLVLLPLALVMKNYKLDEIEQERGVPVLRHQPTYEQLTVSEIDESEAYSRRSSTSTIR